MSIHKKPFEALLDGRKKHEFRRKFYLNQPCRVIFYVSSPVKAIMGIGVFDTPIKTSVNQLINIIKTHNFSSEESLKDYFKGLKEGYALPLKSIKRITPLSLNELRKKIKNFFPPQSYCNFSFDKFKNILDKLGIYET